MGLKRATKLLWLYLSRRLRERAESIRVPSVSAEADLKFSYYDPHSTRTVWTTCKVVSFPFPRFRELSDPSCTARGLEHLPPLPPLSMRLRFYLPTVFSDQTFLSFVRKRHHSHHHSHLTAPLSSLTSKHGPALSSKEPPVPSSAASEKDTTSVLSLLREDYVTVKGYMKVMDYKHVLKRAVQRHMYSEHSSF